MKKMERIVITGIGLTAPNGNNLAEFRSALLESKPGVRSFETRYMGKVPAGLCDFPETQYQKKKMRRRGTRAGAIGIYCANEALNDSGIDWDTFPKDRLGIYVGTTEHGNVETENEIYELHQNNLDVSLWSHHHNPRTVANAPAGEITLNLGSTGPHYTIGAACAAGNMGLIQAAQMLSLGEVDLAIAGGVSESVGTFGIFAAFAAEGALAQGDDPATVCRPLDQNRNGVVISEGGCLFALERLEDALQRKAKIYGELAGYGINSDASDFILPNSSQQKICLEMALKKAGISASDIDIVNLHATGTKLGDASETKALQQVFVSSTKTLFNCTKGLIGHAMGAAGALELAGNLLSFEDNLVHPCFNLENVDPECHLPGLVLKRPQKKDNIQYILNNSFGMLGINSVVIIKKFEG